MENIKFHTNMKFSRNSEIFLFSYSFLTEYFSIVFLDKFYDHKQSIIHEGLGDSNKLIGPSLITSSALFTYALANKISYPLNKSPESDC